MCAFEGAMEKCISAATPATQARPCGILDAPEAQILSNTDLSALEFHFLVMVWILG